MDLSELSDCSRTIRHNIIEMIHEAGSGHPGGSLSVVDILVTLYFGGILHYDLRDPTYSQRDRVILSKGHAAPALYATLAEIGYIKKDDLKTLRKLGSILQGHPDSNLCPGIEVSTGSLGQGLSIAAGLAAGLKIKNSSAYVFCILGDGECEEGQIWEAATFASFNQLNNLVAIIDQNGLQIDGFVQDVCETGSLYEKFRAFGWNVYEVDGHNLEALNSVLSKCRNNSSKLPQAIIAHTIKGKGVSFMENQIDWHGKAPDDIQTKQALYEIDNEVSCG